MKYLSVCSGIEAATVACHPLGWRSVAFSEIDRFPSAVLAHHYPEVPNLGDMTKFQEWPDYEPDVLVGGTPCQSFSVAGLRAGLADPRGNLALTYLAVADRYRPKWLVWENVPGVLSSARGRDFGTFLGGLGQLGYGFAYRILDAQYFGVPQRRRRVFVVGHLGDWRRAAAVLFEQESLRRNPPPGRGQGEEITGTFKSCSNSGGCGTDFDCDGGLIAKPVRSRAHKGPSSECDDQTLVCGPLVSGYSPNGHGRAGVNSQAANSGHIVPVAFAENSRAEVRLQGGDGQMSSQLITGGGKPGQGMPCVAFNARQDPDAWADRTGPCDTDGSTQAVSQDMAVRRLTPKECERLQGFPDDYTLIPYRGRPADKCPDGPRYKALGNSMAVPVMRWIGARIHLLESLMKVRSAA